MGELDALSLSQGAGAVAGIGNTYAQAQAARGQQGYANTMTNVNSEWSKLQQAQLLSRGDIAGSRARLGYEHLASSQRAAFAANGVNVNAGSASAIQSETRALGAIERLQIQQAAYGQALGLRAEDLAARGQNRMRQLATRNNINQSYMAAAANVGQQALRAAYFRDRYKGLDQSSKSALDLTLDYTAPDLMKPVSPYDASRDPNRVENA